MRNRFAHVMTELAQENSDLCLLSGDIGNRMFDRYKEVAPSRFFNCGIAEANMMSMAAGMALTGLKPVVYTITPFTTTRCLEQIRTGVAYHDAPVIIVGTGSGLSYAELGATHHSLEDISILKNIPNLQICAPADSNELEAQLRDAVYSSKPTYIRIGKKGEPDIFDERHDLGIQKANFIREGSESLILCIGPITIEAIKAADRLAESNIFPGIATMGSVKPIDITFLEKAIEAGYKRWLTLEEHHKNGGLGTAIAEWLSDNKIRDIELIRLGIGDKFIHRLGNQEYVRRNEGIDFSAICSLLKGQ